MLENSGSKTITPQMVRTLAETARRHIRLEGGGYRRDHLRALAQRVEVADGEVRIIGSKSRLLQVLTGKNGVNSVPTQGLKWRKGCPLMSKQNQWAKADRRRRLLMRSLMMRQNPSERWRPRANHAL
jgi:hypothetical protein